MIEKAVSKALKSGPIYTPTEYTRIIRAAKKTGSPYQVTELSHTDFIDWKDVTKQVGSNFTMLLTEEPAKCKKDNEEKRDNIQEENKIKIGDLKVAKVVKNEPRIMYIKTSYQQEEFKRIRVDDNE